MRHIRLLLASRLEIYLPFCDQIERLVVPRVVNHRKPTSLGGPNPTAPLNKAIVHRPDRMIDILNIMQKYDVEPKRIRFVYPKMNRDSHVLLVEGMYKGKKGLKIEPPLYAHNDDGSYSNEVRRMFGEKIDE